MNGKLANGVGSQYSHTTSERSVYRITNADAHTSAASSRLNSLPRADLNGLVRLGERRNVVSARVPSGSTRAIHTLKEYTSTKRLDVSALIFLSLVLHGGEWSDSSLGCFGPTTHFT